MPDPNAHDDAHDDADADADAPDGPDGPDDPDDPGAPDDLGAPDDPAASATTCCVCGTVAPYDRPATWSLQVGSRGRQWLCEACTRVNVRSIEGKLDEAWW